jgi:hypothetical protein
MVKRRLRKKEYQGFRYMSILPTCIKKHKFFIGPQK